MTPGVWWRLTSQTSAWTAQAFYWAPRWCGWARVSCRTAVAEDGRGSDGERTARLAARAAGRHGGPASPGWGRTFGTERWGGWVMETGTWCSPVPPEARRSWLSWAGGEVSALPRACRATSLAGKNLERKAKVQIRPFINTLYTCVCADRHKQQILRSSDARWRN